MDNPIDPYERIVWSADVPNMLTLLVLLEEMPQLTWVKLDRLFFERNGWSAYLALYALGKKVFDDAKLIEVPHKLEELAENRCKQARPAMLNCMAHAISNGNYDVDKGELDGLKRFSDVCHRHDVIPCAVTVLTSKTEEVVYDEFNQRFPRDQVLWYAEQLLKAGFGAMVCSPKEAQAIRKMREFDGIQLFTPGVRPAGSDRGSQARFTTPAEAISNGSDYLVIGGPITNIVSIVEGKLCNADKASAAVDAIASEIQPVLV